MRILHVVTLVSEDGAFGGPLRVALNDAEEMVRRGHKVEIAAGYRGRARPPQFVQELPAHLFRARPAVPRSGFSGMVSPGLSRWLRDNVHQFDVVHLHAGRDLITQLACRALRRAKAAYVLQTHGMVPPLTGHVAAYWDRFLTGPCMRGARKCYALTAREEAELTAQFPDVEFERLPNGVSTPSVAVRTPTNEVLYVARLEARKRPVAFVEMARELLDRGVRDVRFTMVGPDEGELSRVRRRITELALGDRVYYEGPLPYDQVLSRMGRAIIYVLPSVDEPFPMTLLEAMSLGIPSVCTDSCGIADELAAGGGAVVSRSDTASMADAVQNLLIDRARREELARDAIEMVRSAFSISAVCDRLLWDYAVTAGVDS